MLVAAAAVALAVGVGAGLLLSGADDRPAPRTVVSTRTENRTETRTETRTVTRPRAASSRGKRTSPPPPPSTQTGTTTGAAPAPTTEPARPEDEPASRGRGRRYAGTGDKRLGTVTVRRASRLTWTTEGSSFQLVFDGGVAVDAVGPRGEFDVPAQRYRDVVVRTRGRWTMRIRPG